MMSQTLFCSPRIFQRSSEQVMAEGRLFGAVQAVLCVAYCTAFVYPVHQLCTPRLATPRPELQAFPLRLSPYAHCAGSGRNSLRGGAAASNMGLVEAAKSFPWVLIPGMVAAGILVKEGGFGSIKAFLDETLDYLEEKGGYIITEV